MPAPLIEPVRFYCRHCKGTTQTLMRTEFGREVVEYRKWTVVTVIETVTDNIRCCSHCGEEIEIWPDVHREEKWIRKCPNPYLGATRR